MQSKNGSDDRELWHCHLAAVGLYTRQSAKRHPGDIWTVKIWTVKTGLGARLGLGLGLGFCYG